MFSTLLKCCIVFHIVSTTAGNGVKGCLHPGKKLHTIATMSRKHDEDGVYPVGTNITYRCDYGFEILNSQIRQCSPDGTWSGTEPYCGMHLGGFGEVLEIQPPVKDVVGKKLNEVFTDCNEKILSPTSTTIWVIRLIKSYRIDRIKLSFKADDEAKNKFDVPDVSYSLANDTTSSLDRQTNKFFNHIGQGVHTDLNAKFATFQYDNDSPFSSSIITLTINWRDENLELCDIGLYSSSAIPDKWCGPDSHSQTKHLLYDDRCYVVLGYRDGTDWINANKSCREYQGRQSYLAKFGKDKNDRLNYIHHSVMNTELSHKYYWISYENETHSCPCVKLPKVHVPPSRGFELGSRDTCECQYTIGRICEHDIPVCGSPDQNYGTQMVSHERNATYSCPKNFQLVGSASRFCSNGQWSPPAPTCARVENVHPADKCSCDCDQPKKQKVITIDLTIELVMDDDID